MKLNLVLQSIKIRCAYLAIGCLSWSEVQASVLQCKNFDQANCYAKTALEAAELDDSFGFDEDKLFLLAPAAFLKANILDISGFEHFLEKTNLSEQLGDTEKYSLGVDMAISLAYYHYFTDLLASGVSKRLVNTLTIAMNMRRSMLKQAIFKGARVIELPIADQAR